MMTATETYAALIDAAHAQRARLHGEEAPGTRWDHEVAQRFRHDPHRNLDANLDIIAAYVEPQDVLIDVGGGAGRICLPMALRCREGIVVDMSEAMGEAALAVHGRRAEPGPVEHHALEPELHVALPGEANATVKLHGRPRDIKDHSVE